MEKIWKIYETQMPKINSQGIEKQKGLFHDRKSATLNI